MRTKQILFEVARWAAVVVAVVFLMISFGGNTVSNADPADVETAVLNAWGIQPDN